MTAEAVAAVTVNTADFTGGIPPVAGHVTALDCTALHCSVHTALSQCETRFDRDLELPSHWSGRRSGAGAGRLTTDRLSALRSEVPTGSRLIYWQGRPGTDRFLYLNETSGLTAAPVPDRP